MENILAESLTAHGEQPIQDRVLEEGEIDESYSLVHVD